MAVALLSSPALAAQVGSGHSRSTSYSNYTGNRYSESNYSGQAVEQSQGSAKHFDCPGNSCGDNNNGQGQTGGNGGFHGSSFTRNYSERFSGFSRERSTVTGGSNTTTSDSYTFSF